MIKNILSKLGVCLVMIVMLSAVAACDTPTPVPAQPDEPQSSAPAASEKPASSEPQVKPEAPSEDNNYVEVAYFHTKRRCGPCTYIEIRTQHNIETYFQDELASGKLEFNVYELGLKENEAVATKYQAVGSQLFINTIVDGKDNIRHMEAVWEKEYLDDQEKFDALIQDLVKEALEAAG